jgi:hypothetical protein
MDVQIEHDEARGEFAAVVDGRKSFLRYARVGDGTLDLRSTFVHPDLRGRGLGEKLVRRALDHARANDLDVIPTCWFVDTVVARHPGYRELIRP